MARSRAIARARFLAMLAGGGALAAIGGRKLWAIGGARWRYNTIEFPTPVFDPAQYRLVVDGLVERPVALTYDELRGLESARQVSDFHCVEGWGVSDVRWEGVRLQTLLERVRPARAAQYITFHSLGQEYRDSLSVQQALLPDVLLAYEMDGAPLTKDHGAPLRLVMPRMYGYKGPKWVTRVEFRDRQDIGYWEYRGWRVDAWIKT